jgi:dTMP kinase
MSQLVNTGIVSEVPLGAGVRTAPADAAVASPVDAAASASVSAAGAGAQGAPRGVFITFEGGEGAGKSTHIRFLAAALADAGREVVRLREPGGTTVGEQLRGVVLNPGNTTLSDACELLIYEAARAQLVAEVIKPALDRGAVVLSDRFYDSTVAYQGFGRGLDRGFIEAANAFACQGIAPDRTILLVAPSAEEGLERATRHAGADRIERAGADFHSRVNDAFLQIAAEQKGRIRVIESAGKKSDTARAVFSQLEDLFPWMSDFVANNRARFEHLDVERIMEGQS